MFTGLVEQVGSLLHAQARAVGTRLTISHAFGPLLLGESIAVSGACLTVVDSSAEALTVDVSPETLSRTTLGELTRGATVNLERAACLGDRLGGHLVTGHVDGVGHVRQLIRHSDMTELELELGADLGRFAAPKGSITVDGVSLTINSADRTSLRLMLIPHTLAVTTLGQLELGRRVNVEVDLVARYVERLLETRA